VNIQDLLEYLSILTTKNTAATSTAFTLTSMSIGTGDKQINKSRLYCYTIIQRQDHYCCQWIVFPFKNRPTIFLRNVVC